MATLHMNTKPVHTVSLEDWQELGDDSLNPLNILIEEEETTQQTGATKMSTKTQSNKPVSSFDVKNFLSLAQAIDGVSSKDVRLPCPEWLVIKNGLGCTTKNAFWVTAGIVKSTRQIIDALRFTNNQLELATDRLTMQELRAGCTAPEVNKYGKDATKQGVTHGVKGAAHLDVMESDAKEWDEEEDHGSHTKLSGFNPDGFEYDEALEEAALLVDKLESVIANGERILSDVIAWIDTNALDLGLEVETGHTVKLGCIGNEIRTARREPLTWQTLLVGIQLQREFISSHKQ